MAEVLQQLPRPEAISEVPGRPSQMTDEELLGYVRIAVQAADNKKAEDIVILRLTEITSFTDYFVICTGNSTRQVQAIADEVTDRLKEYGMRSRNTEGYNSAEWVLIDYGAFVVHIFSGNARRFYDLERLWRDAERVEFTEKTDN